MMQLLAIRSYTGSPEYIDYFPGYLNTHYQQSLLHDANCMASFAPYVLHKTSPRFKVFM